MNQMPDDNVARSRKQVDKATQSRDESNDTTEQSATEPTEIASNVRKCSSDRRHLAALVTIAVAWAIYIAYCNCNAKLSTLD